MPSSAKMRATSCKTEMCGICGITGDIPNLEKTINSMLSSIKYRGPDEQGYLVKNGVAIGNCRLSIIDLASGKQPITNHTGTVHIVFNGEIYNYKELRNDYLKEYEFKTNSDTEVILHLYEKFGTNLLNYLNGMFALCIYDETQRTLFLARDRAGKKPLYYYKNDSSFIFGSELKTIISALSNKPEISALSLSKYFIYDYVPDPDTIYSDIKRLPAAYYMIYDLDKRTLHIERYWKINFSHSKSPPIEETLANLDFHLDKSIKYRLISDVPVGVFLSGGIDSGAVLNYVAKNHAGPISTFTIGFEEKTFDESGLANQLAENFHTNHHVSYIKEDTLLNDFEELTKLLDEPFADYSIVPTYALSKFARSHVKTVISGDGGDELFNGYPTFQALTYWRTLNALPYNLLNSDFLHSVKNPGEAYYPLEYKIKKFTRNTLQDRISFNQYLISSFDRLTFLKSSFEYSPLDNLKEFSGLRDRPLVSNFYFNYYLRSVLHKVDRASMYASLEVRSPFLDKNLLEFIPSLDWAFKSNYCQTKILLRRLLRRKIPDEILYRKKHGFALPVTRLLRGKWAYLIKDYLSHDSLKKHSMFKSTAIEKLVKEHLDNKYDHGKKLWSLLMFQIWYCNFHSKTETA
ncbi:MAG: asparagine synthase (glutamine-hydrolyzing) [Planctomycetes bacterium]|nr:asparagine synthase (glutamine-hydrolyzing) [Planctomycetota bacterium]